MIVFEEAWELRNLQALAIEEECWGSHFFGNFVVIEQKLCLCHHVEYSLPILPILELSRVVIAISRNNGFSESRGHEPSPSTSTHLAEGR